MKRVQGFAWTVADHDLLATTDTWGDALVEIARADKRVVAVTADLATTTKLARMKREMPGRVINVGVAEQNLVAVAAGLAATGLVPIVVTYATFAALRAAEFVRTDVAYNGRDVKIVGTLAGVAFGQGGPTHHAIEDLALMRAIPGMVVLAPSDGDEMGAALRAAVAHQGPVYIRYGRGTEAPVRAGAAFRIGEAVTLREGTQAAILACGPTVSHAVHAAERLGSQGSSVGVVAMPTLKPIDEAAILEAARDTRRLVTVEDHSVVGGLGSAVADVLAEHGATCALRKLGHPDRWLGMGIPEDLMHAAGFDEDGIVRAVAELLRVEAPRDDDWSDEP
jgi:transketolase